MDDIIELESLFNETSHAEYLGLSYTINEILAIIFAFGGVCGNLLIIAAMLSYPKMRTRINTVILHWSITDLLKLILETIVEFWYIIGTKSEYEIFDVFFQMACISHLLSILIQFVLVSNTLVTNKSIDLNILWMLIYGLGAILLVLQIVTLGFELERHTHLIYISVIFCEFALFMTILIKQIRRRLKKKVETLSNNTILRYNIVFLYTGLWSIALFFDVFMVFENLSVLAVLYVVRLVVPIFIIFLLTESDRNYKICFMEIARFNFNSYDLDAKINFLDDCEDEQYERMERNGDAHRDDDIVDVPLNSENYIVQ